MGNDNYAQQARAQLPVQDFTPGKKHKKGAGAL